MVGTLLVSCRVGGGHGWVETQLVTAGAGGVGGGLDPAATPLTVASPNTIVLDVPSAIAPRVTVVLLEDVTKVSPGAVLLVVVVVVPGVRAVASLADEVDVELVAVVSPMMMVFEVPSGMFVTDVGLPDTAVLVVVDVVDVVVVTGFVRVVVATEREVVDDAGRVAAPDPATTSEAAGDAVVAVVVVLAGAGCLVALPAPATTSAEGGSDTPRMPSASTIQRRTCPDPDWSAPLNTPIPGAVARAAVKRPAGCRGGRTVPLTVLRRTRASTTVPTLSRTQIRPPWIGAPNHSPTRPSQR